LAEVLKLLQREHGHIAKVLNVLERQLRHFDQGHTPDYDIIDSALAYCLDFPEFCHHPKEDLIFRRLRERDVTLPLAARDLPVEHQELKALTWKFSAAVNRILQGAEMPRQWFTLLGRDFVTSYRNHIAMEERIFFPAALESLSEQDWAEIDAQVTDRQDPLFGDRLTERFAALYADIQSQDQEFAPATQPRS
jgi:hemerythrin-like domain-containing protein